MDNNKKIELKVKINDVVENVVLDTKVIIRDFVKKYESKIGKKIALIKQNGKVKELSESIENDSDIKFVTIDDDLAISCYIRTANFILIKAIYDVFKKRPSIKFLIGEECYFELPNDQIPTESEINEVKNKFKELVENDISIIRKKINIDQALKLFEKEKMYDKSSLFKYRLYPYVNLYFIDDFFVYSDTHMLDSTGYIKEYGIRKFKDGILLSFSSKDDSEKEAFSSKLFDLQNDGHNWSEKLGVNYIGLFNDALARGEFDDLVILQESMHQKNIGDIAEAILHSNKKVVLIAGPSSSGKTTFSHRLSYHLRSLGLNPHPLECDRFFIDRELTPRDEKGNYNFETLASIKTDRLNECLEGLLNGDEVKIPYYNFQSGISEERGETMKLEDNDILILEGIHCLNDELTYHIKKDDKFKIYISAIPKIAIDKVNRISSSDLRLIRRIVRDNRTRGHSALATIKMWNNVRRGEEKYIFPYQNNCDAIFNSSLIYEFSVLKQYIEPLLFNIPNDAEEIPVARRLLKFLSFFLAHNSETIPKYSIIREFIGGSIIDVV